MRPKKKNKPYYEKPKGPLPLPLSAIVGLPFPELKESSMANWTKVQQANKLRWNEIRVSGFFCATAFCQCRFHLVL